VGNRIKAVRNGVVTKYVFDAAGNLLAEANSSNVITRYYIYGKGLTAMVDAQTNALYVYHHDGTGHTVVLTNAAQQTVNTYAYDPYGRIMAQTEAVAQPFQYAGQFGVIAEGNNLYYMRARYYDANVGRFISEDPIGFQGRLNLYAYVGGNPMMAIDPSGKLTVTFGADIHIPAWLGMIGKMLGFGDDGLMPDGVQIGVAESFPFFDGAERDSGIYFGVQMPGIDIGIGKGSLSIGASLGSVKNLATNTELESSFTLPGFNAGISLDSFSGAFQSAKLGTGVGLNFGQTINLTSVYSQKHGFISK